MRHHDEPTRRDAWRHDGSGMEVPRVARLGELEDYEVADGEPDVRGWPVVTRDGARAGKVDELIVNVGQLEVAYLDVELDKAALRLRDTRHILVPIAAAWLNENEEIVRLGATASELIASPVYEARPFSADDEDLLRRRYAGPVSRSDEEFALGKRRRVSGTVQSRKTRATATDAVVVRKPVQRGGKTVAADASEDRPDTQAR